MGAGASVSAVSSAVADLAAVERLGFRIDTAASRRDAERRIENLWRDNPDEILTRLRSLPDDALEGFGRLMFEHERRVALRRLMDDLPTDAWFEERGALQKRLEAAPDAFLRYRMLPWIALAEQSPTLRDVAPHVFAGLVAAEAEGRIPAIPSVEHLTYRNPIELWVAITFFGVAGLKYGAFAKILEIIRDWPSDREKGKAEAREANARADLMETRAEFARIFARQTARQDELSEARLTASELEAIDRLTDSQITLELDDTDE